MSKLNTLLRPGCNAALSFRTDVVTGLGTDRDESMGGGEHNQAVLILRV